MSASMIVALTVLSGNGRPKRTYISLPRIDDLLSEPGAKYLLLPDRSSPAPKPGPPKGQPFRRRFREVGEPVE